MPRTKRGCFSKRFYYHVYNRGNWKLPVFLDTQDYYFFLKKMKILSRQDRCNINIGAYCLMDNHYHLVIKQLSKVSLSKFMQRLITSYSMYLNKKYHRVGHTFQGRFKARLIRSRNDLEHLIAYIQRNPVIAGYVRSSSDYRWLNIGTDLVWDRPSS
jgi:putative transposase